MAWRNLRSEISEMFAGYAAAEADPLLLEIRASYHLEEKRRADRERYREIMKDPTRKAARRERQRERYHEFIRNPEQKTALRERQRLYMREYLQRKPEKYQAQKQRAIERAHRKALLAHEAYKHAVCAHCKGSFERKLLAGHRRIFCSSRCNIAAQNAKKKALRTGRA